MLIKLSIWSCFEIKMQEEITIYIDWLHFLWKSGRVPIFGNNLKESFSAQEKIKSSLKSWNVCYQSVKNLLSSSLLSKNIKIKIYRTIILRFVLYGCETWPLTLMEKRRLMVFENMVLWRIFGYKWDEVTREWRKLHNEGPTVLYSPAKYYSGNEI